LNKVASRRDFLRGKSSTVINWSINPSQFGQCQWSGNLVNGVFSSICQ
jgi:hypothetical protein